MKLTFLGATQTVTGSKYLLEHAGKKILIDCGLFQGQKELRERNWEKFPIDPAAIDAMVLSHAHIDHSGYIPVLVKNGFRGKIFCSEATFDLCKILLTDSGFLQEEDAARANRYSYSRHKPALPLYSEKDAEDSLKFFHTVEFQQTHYFSDDFYFTLKPSGHILGAAFIEFFAAGEKIVFSGDLGRPHDPIMCAPDVLQQADYLILESTYGNRLHSKTDPIEEIGEVVRSTAAKGGNIIIPAFAVGRAQEVLYYLYQLKQKNAIPEMPIFLDSPMAIDASEIMIKYGGEHRIDKNVSREICKIAKYVRTSEESKKLNQIKFPMIIISASGMAEGGRVLHHLKNYISDYKNTILFTGFQASQTRGDRIVSGEEKIKIHGDFYEVKARIVNLTNSSAHADYEEILQWLRNFRQAPKKVFITHGSLESATSLHEKIEQKFGWDCVIPKYLQTEIL